MSHNEYVRLTNNAYQFWPMHEKHSKFPLPPLDVN